MKKTILIMLTAISTAAMGQTAPDEQAIKTVITTMETGWNQKKGEVYSSVFADVHDFVVWNGYYFPNQTRQGNAQGHQRLFDGPYRTFDIKLKIDKIKLLRPDLALVHVIGAGFERANGIPKDPSVLMSIIMEKKAGNWKIISFHNLDLEMFQDKETADHSPMPAAVMYASWYKN